MAHLHAPADATNTAEPRTIPVGAVTRYVFLTADDTISSNPEDSRMNGLIVLLICATIASGIGLATAVMRRKKVEDLQRS